MISGFSILPHTLLNISTFSLRPLFQGTHTLFLFTPFSKSLLISHYSLNIYPLFSLSGFFLPEGDQLSLTLHYLQHRLERAGERRQLNREIWPLQLDYTCMMQLYNCGMRGSHDLIFVPLFSHNSSFILKIQNYVLVPIFSIQSTVVIQLLLGMALLSHTKTQLRVLRYPSVITQDLF